ncbi:MAG: hypothetical protein ACYC2H_03945 [Thermoplasmatota archaeon]
MVAGAERGGTSVTVATLVLLAALAAGCAGPVLTDDDLPGVYTENTISDEFRCGELLFPHGCVIVRVPRVESGCSPELGGYVVCNATLDWSAESGAALPGSRLSVAADGNETPGCDPVPGTPCKVSGIVNRTRHFSGPGQEETWPIVIEATLSAPGDAAATTGSFTLTIEMRIRTEPTSAVTS